MPNITTAGTGAPVISLKIATSRFFAMKTPIFLPLSGALGTLFLTVQ
jgi:hypothetical protein